VIFIAKPTLELQLPIKSATYSAVFARNLVFCYNLCSVVIRWLSWQGMEGGEGGKTGKTERGSKGPGPVLTAEVSAHYIFAGEGGFGYVTVAVPWQYV
jgi:hypothetical protein